MAPPLSRRLRRRRARTLQSTVTSGTWACPWRMASTGGRRTRPRLPFRGGGGHPRLSLLSNTMEIAIESLIYTRGHRTVTQLYLNVTVRAWARACTCPCEGGSVSGPRGATHPVPAAGTRLLTGGDRPPPVSPPPGALGAPQPAPTVVHRHRSERSKAKKSTCCRRRCRSLPAPWTPANVRDR